MVVGIFIKNENSQKLESFTEAGEQGRRGGGGEGEMLIKGCKVAARTKE